MEAKFPLKENVQYVHRDRNGNIKKLFKHNKLGKFIYKHFGIDFKIPTLFGNLVDKMVIENLITSAGMVAVAARINADAVTEFTYIAVGTGTTAANVADTTLETETATSGLSRAAATPSAVDSGTGYNDTAQLVKTFTVTGSVAVTESGVLNAGAAGTLLAHQVFSAVNVVDGDSLEITWKFVVADGA